MKLLGISGTIIGSKTLTVVKKVLEQAESIHPEITAELLDMKEYDVQFCDGRDPSAYEGDTKKVIDLISSADVYIIGTPIFQGSYTGVLKNLIDLVDPKVFRNKIMGFVATGGSDLHYLVIENQLKPIGSYLHAYMAPSYVYAHKNHFFQDELVDEEVLERVKNLAKELVFMQTALKGSAETVGEIS
ncbi:NADPH-dependent FMN reductase [Peribacillus glennii]|uniref:NADPH-dependent oxidoreductase n=1 Tax=Peribacillus glennii TaxID=2303991 RepID=A0A372LFJ9_9BACI|nr:NAD(P)H-dependent oxidoreductase [Peribacillus glennii]RFU65093.1 NADPH-dependent oxidoreductase [Peribacillus glennii]